MKRQRTVMNQANIARVVEMCRDAALAGKKAPSNAEIAVHLGVTFGGHISRLVALATEDGFITVERGNQSRIIAAADGSWRTAGVLTSTHWRHTPEHERVVQKRRKPGKTMVRAPVKGKEAYERALEIAGRAVRPILAAPVKPVSRSVPGVSWAVDGRGCQWPMWGNERATFVFCDAPRGGSCGPYCAEHAAKSRRQQQVVLAPDAVEAEAAQGRAA